MVDRRRVFVPGDSAARSVGADEVARRITQISSERGLEVEVVRNGSRGLYWLEPLVEVETPEGRIGYGPVTAAEVEGLVDVGFLDGGDHALKIGVTEEIPYLAKQDRFSFADIGVIDPFSTSDYRAHGGLSGLTKALSMSSQEIVAAVSDSGLRGRGGAGFPTGIKWQTVLDAVADEKFVCCNADEGDSGTFADRMVMEGEPFLLIESMAIAGVAVGASVGYVFIRSEYPDALSAMRRAVEVAYEEGWLGSDILGSSYRFDLHVKSGAGAYISGEEMAMLESVEGRRAVVRAKPPLPAIQGLFGKPTLVNNVLSLIAIPRILTGGSKEYRERGCARSRGTQVFQLAGNVAHPGIVEVPFGITLHELLYGFGGGSRSGRPIKAVQVGGPLGSYIAVSDFSMKVDYETFAQAGAMVGHGGIVVHDDNTDMGKMARFAMEFCAVESCGKCTPCRIGSVRGMEVIDRILAKHDVLDNLRLLDDLLETMTDGSLCAMGGLTPMPVRSILKNFSAELGIDSIDLVEIGRVV
ncbi:formate dehydrogenase beta subunit [Ferrimicrobium sp.]|uniref:formate dehydrogenase beta subunit n=1 Tax=Ferrimicrobium sp. TaxID=2926050 RepID=UPI0026377D8F|nr:formate dehydrogenase beta subunit [Ferrimicrobium sp.]